MGLFWRARQDYSAHPCASPLLGYRFAMIKIAPGNFVEPDLTYGHKFE